MHGFTGYSLYMQTHVYVFVHTYTQHNMHARIHTHIQTHTYIVQSFQGRQDYLSINWWINCLYMLKISRIKAYPLAANFNILKVPHYTMNSMEILTRMYWINCWKTNGTNLSNSPNVSTCLLPLKFFYHTACTLHQWLNWHSCKAGGFGPTLAACIIDQCH